MSGRGPQAGGLCPTGNIWQCLKSRLGAVLLACNGQKPGMLLILHAQHGSVRGSRRFAGPVSTSFLLGLVFIKIRMMLYCHLVSTSRSSKELQGGRIPTSQGRGIN